MNIIQYISISLDIFYRRRLVSVSPPPPPPRRENCVDRRITDVNKHREVSPLISSRKSRVRAKQLTESSSRSSSRASWCRADFEFSDLESELVHDDHVPSPPLHLMSIHSSIEKTRKLGKLYFFL